MHGGLSTAKYSDVKYSLAGSEKINVKNWTVNSSCTDDWRRAGSFEVLIAVYVIIGRREQRVMGDRLPGYQSNLVVVSLVNQFVLTVGKS